MEPATPDTTDQESFRKNLGLLSALSEGTTSFITAARNQDNAKLANCLVFVYPMWLHATAILDTLKPREDGKIYWNVPSIAVLARAMQEALLGLAYCCEPVDNDTGGLRALPWDRQAIGKVMEILLTDTTVPGNVGVAQLLATRLDELQGQIESSPGLVALRTANPALAKRVQNRHDNYMAADASDLWRRIGLTAFPYELTWRTLSQWVHLTPLCLHTLHGLTQDIDAAAAEVNRPLQFATACLAISLAMSSDHSGALAQTAAQVLSVLGEIA